MRHVSKRGDGTALRVSLKQLAEKKPAWAYRLLHLALCLEGWHYNHKKTYRLYREEN